MERPDPDKLLAQVKQKEVRQERGKLKIFLGATAGVGKTYAMLHEAHRRKNEGVDVVIGYIEPHGRSETETQTQGLEAIPPLQIPYRSTTLQEVDLDAALLRHPELILVDELAHTNAEGSRHTRRYHDVEELLKAGINVYTTINVQHLESLNDLVAQITGVIVRETVPDAIIDQADEVEVIDLPPDDLIQRLREGKIYRAEQARQAEKNFFRKGNLMALRELALRRTADRVDAQMQNYMQDHSIATTWPVSERLLVCIAPGKLAMKLVRTAKRMATRLKAEWIVAHVETAGFSNLPIAKRDSVVQALRLAERLGAQTVTLTGQKVSDEIVNYARSRNVSKIVVGKPEHSPWYHRMFGSHAEDIITKSGVIDVYVLSGDFEDTESPPARVITTHSKAQDYAITAVVVAVCTGIAALMYDYFELSNLIMVYLLGTVGISRYVGRGPSVMMSVLSVLAFDFFFVPPRFTLAVSDTQYLITFGVMLLAGLIISTLTTRLREQAQSARDRERRTAALYNISKELSARRDKRRLAEVAIRQINDLFDSSTAILLKDKTAPGLKFEVITSPEKPLKLDLAEEGVARWVYEHNQPAGVGTDTLPGSKGFYLPLATAQRLVGVLAMHPQTPDAAEVQLPEQVHLLETFANQVAQAIERAELTEEAEQSQVQVASERLRNSLLSSVSHDLRTPLTAISGSAGSLLADEARLDTATRRKLTQGIYDETERLSRLVNNLLEVTRLEAGGVKLNQEWQLLEEIIGSSLSHLRPQLGNRKVQLDLPPELPPVLVDGVLLEQVFINLLENAAKYSPPESKITIAAQVQSAEELLVQVIDEGKGLPPDSEHQLFEKFYRGHDGDEQRGVGLGLAICKGIIEAHSGRIWAANRLGAGAIFGFTLPTTDQAANGQRYPNTGN